MYTVHSGIRLPAVCIQSCSMHVRKHFRNSLSMCSCCTTQCLKYLIYHPFSIGSLNFFSFTPVHQIYRTNILDFIVNLSWINICAGCCIGALDMEPSFHSFFHFLGLYIFFIQMFFVHVLISIYLPFSCLFFVLNYRSHYSCNREL